MKTARWLESLSSLESIFENQSVDAFWLNQYRQTLYELEGRANFKKRRLGTHRARRRMRIKILSEENLRLGCTELEATGGTQNALDFVSKMKLLWRECFFLAVALDKKSSGVITIICRHKHQLIMFSCMERCQSTHKNTDTSWFIYKKYLY